MQAFVDSAPIKSIQEPNSKLCVASSATHVSRYYFHSGEGRSARLGDHGDRRKILRRRQGR